MKKKTIIIVTLALVLLCSSVYFYKEYLFKPSRNISSEIPSFELSAEKLVNAYRSGVQKADALYLNKTIDVTGIAAEVNDSVIQVDKNVFCLFNEKISPDLVGKKVTIKGSILQSSKPFKIYCQQGIA